MENRRPQFSDPWEAARVSTFTGPGEVGRWRRKHFSITQEHYNIMRARAIAEGGPFAKLRAERTVPPGKYITLMRKATPGELEDIDSGDLVDALAPGEEDERYIPVMSDTPAEIGEHAEAITEASGDVLITGLGLGVIVSALLAKDDVKSITVVEIDRDVIALTGPFYADEPRVRVVNMDARNAAQQLEAEGLYFDYAWHDIWTFISEGNLHDDERAEHGLSYSTMFALYDGICDTQGAWAWDEANQALYAREEEVRRTEKWVAAFVDPEATYAQRLRLLVIWHAVDMMPQLSLAEEIPDDLYSFFFHQMQIGPAVVEQLKVRGHEAMAADIRRDSRGGVVTLTAHARPNEDKEANVA